MNNKLIFLFFFFLGQNLFSEVLTYNDWKVDVDSKTGRFFIYYKDIPLNAKDYPVTSYSSIKVGKDVYHLGEDIGVSKIEKMGKKIIFIYKINAKLSIEIEIGFGDNPFVYDDKVIDFQIRIDNRLDKPTDISYRFVFDTAVGENKNQGYLVYPDLKKEITTEYKDIFSFSESKLTAELNIKETKDTVIFYPYFIKAFPTPGELFLSSWQRLDEDFNPVYKPLLNFRDMRSSKWDPAITYFYHFEKAMQQVDLIKFSIGIWQKPNRSVPRVKIYYPEEITIEENKKIEIPILVENNGDYNIDFFKTTFTSPVFKTQLIQSGVKMELGQKVVVKFEETLKQEMEKLNGEVRIILWNEGKTYELPFLINIKIKKKVVLGRKTEQPLKEKEKKQGIPLLNMSQIKTVLEKIELLMYFINMGLEKGMAPEMAQKMKGEINELEKQSDQ